MNFSSVLAYKLVCVILYAGFKACEYVGFLLRQARSVSLVSGAACLICGSIFVFLATLPLRKLRLELWNVFYFSLRDLSFSLCLFSFSDSSFESQCSSFFI